MSRRREPLVNIGQGTTVRSSKTTASMPTEPMSIRRLKDEVRERKMLLAADQCGRTCTIGITNGDRLIISEVQAEKFPQRSFGGEGI